MKRTPLDAWIARKIGRADRALTRADLEAYQLQKLRATLYLARERSQFYRNQLADMPPDLSSLAALGQLPFTTTDEVRANPLGFLCVSQDAIQRVVTLDTSGTSGSPKRIYFTRDDQELTIDFFRVGMSTFTGPGDRVLILLPGGTPGSVGDLLAKALTRLGAIPIKQGPVSDPAATLTAIFCENIDVIVGVPTHILALVRQPNEPPPRLKSVLLTTDHVPDAIKQAVESAWRCTVYNHYGMTEMGLGGGVECEARRGYHLREADIFFEIIDPVTGNLVPDGEYGEVVFTTLTRHGMPLIRYRTGDRGCFMAVDCPCGTCLKTLERITQRLSGRIPVGNGVLTMADLDEVLFAIDGVLDFRATLATEDGRDTLQLDIRLANDTNVPATLGSISQALVKSASQQVHIQLVNSIPATMAKRAIVDHRIARE